MRAELASIGRSAADISLIFNSHGHPDHMGGNASLRAETDAEIAAPLGEAVWVEDHERHWRELWAANPGVLDLDEDTHKTTIDVFCGADTRVDRMLRDGDTIEVGARLFSVIQTRGHSPDHLALFERDSGLLLVFDDVQASGTAWLDGSGLLAPLYDDPDEYVAGLLRLRGLPFSTMLRSHALPVGHDEGIELIDESIRWVARVEACVDEMLQAGEPIATARLAHAIGCELGRYGGVCLQTVRVAHGHLLRRARAGELQPAWHVTSAPD